MWQRFTERARKVVFFAQEEAQRYGEGYVSTEHMLLGLLREDCTATRAMKQLGGSVRRIKTEVERQLPRGEARINQDMTLTPRAKRVIDLAYDEARSLSNNFIGTEHLLLGLIREGDGLAARVLAKCNVDLEPARKAVLTQQNREGEVLRTPAEPAIRTGPIRVAASHLYLIHRDDVRPLFVMLCALVDSERLQVILQANGVEPARVLVSLESLIFQTALQPSGTGTNMTRLLTTGRPDPADGEYDSGFLFLAGLVESDNLSGLLGISPSIAIKVLEELRLMVKPHES